MRELKKTEMSDISVGAGLLGAGVAGPSRRASRWWIASSDSAIRYNSQASMKSATTTGEP